MIQPGREPPPGSVAPANRVHGVAKAGAPPVPGTFDPASWSVPNAAHVARIREVLSSLIDLADMSRREVERRLAAQGFGFDLNRFFSGKFHAKLDQILDVCRVLELHPVELFRLVFKPPERRSPVLERFNRLFGANTTQPVARPPTVAQAGSGIDELRRRIEKLQKEIDELRRTADRIGAGVPRRAP
jgi:hypothetical protein